MITAKLIKDLEKEGFELDFPSYATNEGRIIDTLKEKNERLYLAIPLLLKQKFNYKAIIEKLTKEEKRNFDKIILITNKIFTLEKINNEDLKRIIEENSLKQTINKEELQYYYNSFEQFTKKRETILEEQQIEQIELREKLMINKSLSKIFSPAKIRIMKKIIDHEKLTPTELKYYYKAIKPLIEAILNENMQKYLGLVGVTKKYN